MNSQNRFTNAAFHRFHNKHHVDVFGSAKLMALRGQPLMAGHAADKHECFAIACGVLTKEIESTNHWRSHSIRS